MDCKSPDLEHSHCPNEIALRLAQATRHSYLGDFVLGAVDGTVTTFAIVASAAGAGLSSGVALVLGVANVLADGFSMAAGNYLKAKADKKIVEKYRRIEEKHIEHMPEGEKEEIRQIFSNKGFEGEVLEKIVEVITSNKQRWVDTMLTEEWGVQLDPPNETKSALTTMFAFVLAGIVPLVPLVFTVNEASEDVFLISATLTGFTFFLTGCFRGKISGEKKILLSGLETLVIGGIAAILAYNVGAFLDGFVN